MSIIVAWGSAACLIVLLITYVLFLCMTVVDCIHTIYGESYMNSKSASVHKYRASSRYKLDNRVYADMPSNLKNRRAA